MNKIDRSYVTKMRACTAFVEPPSAGVEVGLLCESWLALEAENATLRADRDRYHDALIARPGGEPVALLSELDALRAKLARLVAAAEPAACPVTHCKVAFCLELRAAIVDAKEPKT